MNRRSFLHTTALASAAIPLIDRSLWSSMVLRPPLSTVQSASMWVYLWDLVDEGCDAVFGRLRDNGLTAISLACAYHTGKFLAPHNPKRKVVFLEDGTIYFQPRPELYGRIKPRVNSLVKEGNGLDQVRRSAESFGLTSNAWVVCCHNSALGSAYPDIACQDVFGDTIYHSLCPSNPDVRMYLRALVQDLASRGVERIELEAMQFQPYAHGYHHEREGIALSVTMKFLLGLCFCRSCLERAASAGVDAGEVWKFTRRELDLCFQNPQAENEKLRSLDDLPKEIFGPFLEWRQRVVASLAAELMESAKGHSVALRPLVSIDPTVRLVVGMNPMRVSEITGGILVPGYVRDGAALREPLRLLQNGKEIIVGFQVGLPESGGKGEFLDRMEAARGLGITKFNFYNYGFIPLENLTWIKEAVS